MNRRREVRHETRFTADNDLVWRRGADRDGATKTPARAAAAAIAYRDHRPDDRAYYCARECANFKYSSLWSRPLRAARDRETATGKQSRQANGRNRARR